MTVTKTTKHHTIHAIFASFQESRYIIILPLSLVVYIIPITSGVVLLLIYAQINISTNYLAATKSKLSKVFTTLAIWNRSIQAEGQIEWSWTKGQIKTLLTLLTITPATVVNAEADVQNP